MVVGLGLVGGSGSGSSGLVGAPGLDRESGSIGVGLVGDFRSVGGLGLVGDPGFWSEGQDQ